MKRKPINYWNKETVILEYNRIKEEIGSDPTLKILDSYNTSIGIYMVKFFGSTNEFRKEVSSKKFRTTNSYWNEDTLVDHIKTFMKVNNLNTVNYSTLRSFGENGLLNAMKRQKFNLKTLCDKHNIECTTTPKGYLTLGNILLEFSILIEKYGTIPTREILLEENKSSLMAMMERHHGGMKTLRKHFNIEKSYTSSLEVCAKNILDSILNDSHYVDNKRKQLIDYGVNLYNKNSNQWLELDRYYYNKKLAIEIQGRQHYSQNYFKNNVSVARKQINNENDKIKKELLAEQNVTLLEIPYNKCSHRFIYNSLKELGYVE